ncbi:MAG: DUF3822 family protein [Bacteroidia bacterium]|nr:DUF3822 family protein [Bacteroidia bacterium]MDW8334674.1 DUF3822 family protein [Bacteroidia bacterium]
MSFEADYIAPGFDAQFPWLYRMSATVSHRGFAYAIATKAGDAAVVRHVPGNGPPDSPEVLAAAAQQDELLKNPWEPVEIVVHDPRWTLAPGEFVPAGSEPKYLDALFDPAPRHVVRDFVRSLKLCVIYAVDDALMQKCTYFFRRPKFKHILTAFLLFHRRIHPNPSTPYTATIAAFGTRFLYLVFKGEEPIFANIFPLAGPEDVIYYVKAVNQAVGVGQWRYYFHDPEPTAARLLESFFPGAATTGADFFAHYSDSRVNLFARRFGYLLTS